MKKFVLYLFFFSFTLSLPQVVQAISCTQLFKDSREHKANLSEFLNPGEIEKIDKIINTKARLPTEKSSTIYFRGLSRVSLETLETTQNNIHSIHGDTTWAAKDINIALAFALPLADHHFRESSLYNSLILELRVPNSIRFNNNGLTASFSTKSLPEEDLAPLINRIGVIKVSAQQVETVRSLFPKISQLSRLQKLVEKMEASPLIDELFLFSDSPLNSELNYNVLFNQFFSLHLMQRVLSNDPAFIHWIDIP